MPLIQLNGIYDILCAATMLKLCRIPILRKLHLGLLANYEHDNPVLERFFAYWVMTYGIMRLSGHPLTIQASYFIEAFLFANECYIHRTIKRDVGTALIVSCISIGVLT